MDEEKKKMTNLIKNLSPLPIDLYIRIVFLTSYLKIINKCYLTEAKNKFKNIIYVFWHNVISILSYVHRFSNISALVSPSVDGEIVNRVLSRWGYETVRGSSFKEPVKSLSGMIEKIKNGYDLAIAVDAPRGPVYVAKKGAAFIAKLTKKPLLPLTASARFKKILNTWDKHLIPFPFNEIVVVYGEPIIVEEGNDVAEKTELLSTTLKKITEIAEGYFK